MSPIATTPKVAQVGTLMNAAYQTRVLPAGRGRKHGHSLPAAHGQVDAVRAECPSGTG